MNTPVLILIGLNHETAPVEIRECIAFPDVQTALRQLHQKAHIEEVMLLSTCNRVEILLATNHASLAIRDTKEFIARFNGLSLEQFETSLYVYEGDHAVRHIFRVAASLDSMMVGEPQILGQLKDAYKTATENRTSGVLINRLLHRAFFVAKRVRTETGIGDHAVSISYAAIELGRKIFGTLEGKQVLLIGAGEMAELAVEHLVRHHADTISVANRTMERGLELARRFQGRAISMEEIPDMIAAVDIVISSTGAPGYIVTKDHVKSVIRKRRNRPLFFIDIAVPRDIDPDVNRLPNTYVYDIDDLKSVIEENLEDRSREAIKAERIIDEAVIRFRDWYVSLEVVPTLVRLRGKVEQIAAGELEKTLQSGRFRDDDAQLISRMVHSLVKKILHEPTVTLKQCGCRGDKSVYIDVTRRLFRLDEDSPEPSPVTRDHKPESIG